MKRNFLLLTELLICFTCYDLSKAVEGTNPSCIYWSAWTEWTEWTEWTDCSESCGPFGTRSRERLCCGSFLSNCFVDEERSTCNRFCENGGTLGSSMCLCSSPYSGHCCEVSPTCYPECRNDGVCIAEDTCKCSTMYYGPRCEIGSTLEDRFLPQLQTALSPQRVYEKLSWYDAPAYSGENKICFIKISAENAYFDTIASATSSHHDEHSLRFGNFSAAPIDSEAKLNGSSRFACLQVRCPGVFKDGKTFDIDVQVSIQPVVGTCSVTSTAEDVEMRIIRESTNTADTVEFHMRSGENYGRNFGIYVASGFRDKAEYLARMECQSGNRFEPNLFNPEKNVLIKYECH